VEVEWEVEDYNETETETEAAATATPTDEATDVRPKKLRAVDIYWMEDGSNEKHYNIPPDRDVVLYAETVDYSPGETLKMEFVAPVGRKFKGGKDKMIIDGKVRKDGTVVIWNFRLNYELEIESRL
jgi:hypothetical protein